MIHMKVRAKDNIYVLGPAVRGAETIEIGLFKR